jgi:hypothetical protein
MTPPAAAATGRTLPRTAAPRTARRVSGPAVKTRRGEDAARRAEPGRRADAPRRAAGSARTRTAAPDPFIIRAIERTMKMADSRFLDRLIRGRLWIPLVAAGLMGIVFMQVSMLKLNAGIGRAVQSAQTLERQNSLMRAQVSGMESGSKIDETAKSLGMVAPAASTTPSFVTAGGRDQASAAAKHMTAADPEAVARTKAVEGATSGTTLASGATAGAGTGATGAATTGVAAAGATTTGATGATGTAAPAAGATTAGGTTGASGTAASGATTSGTATSGTATSGTTTGAATSGTATGAGGGAATAGTATGATGGTGTGTTTGTGTAAGTTQSTSTSGGAVAPAVQ